MRHDLTHSQSAPAYTASISYRILTNLSDVLAIAPAWDRLLYQSPCNRAFSSVHWFLKSVDAARSCSLYVITAWHQHTLVGISTPLQCWTIHILPSFLPDYAITRI